MTDTRFYSLLLVFLTSVCIAAFVILDCTQPAGINVDLLNKILTFVSPTVGFLILLANSNRNATNVTAIVEKQAAVIEKKADELAASVTNPKEK